jgi:tetratricopeptide (TPR) repeat protein
VLVGLYRYYFYQHRLAEALDVAYRAMRLASARLGISDDWRRLDEHGLAVAAAQSFGLLRFYLLALKAAGVVLLRLGDIDNARDHLSKLAALDQRDQLGASALLDIIDPVPDVSAA